MSVQTVVEVDAVTRRSSELHRRWMLAILADPSLLDEIPDGCALELLPDDDPELVAHSIELGLSALKRGFNVYFRHVRPADLPD